LRTRVLLAAALCAVAVRGRADQTVDVGPGLSFSPSTVTIAPGETVTWTWLGSPHSTTSDSTSGAETWDSGVLTTGATFSHTFASPGSYPYYCTVHGAPGGVGMSGTVIVAAPTPTPTVPPTATPTPGGPLPAIPDLGISGRIGLAMALAGVALLLLLSIRSR
jgi:plastocyanin